MCKAGRQHSPFSGGGAATTGSSGPRHGVAPRGKGDTGGRLTPSRRAGIHPKRKNGNRLELSTRLPLRRGLFFEVIDGVAAVSEGADRANGESRGASAGAQDAARLDDVGFVPQSGVDESLKGPHATLYQNTDYLLVV